MIVEWWIQHHIYIYIDYIENIPLSQKSYIIKKLKYNILLYYHDGILRINILFNKGLPILPKDYGFCCVYTLLKDEFM